MRLLLALALLTLLAPLGAAESQQGATLGVDLGYVAPGVWDVWHVELAGLFTVTLTWEAPPVFFSDYDLRLYQPGALDDRLLTDDELLAESSQHPLMHHSESITGSLGPGVYLAAVVPYQTQMEIYTLTGPGAVQYAAAAPGFVAAW
jgi:hypothetical protein